MNPALFTSIIFAICIHLVAAGLLKYFGPHIPIPEKRSIPVRLLSADSAPTQSSQASSSSSQSNDAINRISTTGQSTHSTTRAENISSDRNPSPSKTQKPLVANKQLPNIPTMPSSNQSQAARSRTTQNGLRELFSSQNAPSQASIKQVSTKDTPLLSEYEQMLWEQIASSRGLFDEYHEVLANTGKETIDYQVTINLFPNGQIKKATISQSSGIKKIDELAVQTIYSASPFPRPPAEDITKGYKYTISISYRKSDALIEANGAG